MKSSTTIICIITFIAVFFTGCLPERILYSYTPNAQNVPLNSGMHESHFLAANSGATEFPANEIQGSFTISPKWAVMVDYMGINSNSTGHTVRGYYVDGALSYYYAFGKHGSLEMPIGLGFESLLNQFALNDYARINLIKPFVQPQMGFHSGAFDIAVSLRLAALQYFNFQDHLTTFAYGEDNFRTDPLYLVAEPCATIRLGWKYVKFQMQFGITTLGGEDIYVLSGGNFNIGLFISVPSSDKAGKPVN